jgi:protein-disulfide isomerase
MSLMNNTHPTICLLIGVVAFALVDAGTGLAGAESGAESSTELATLQQDVAGLKTDVAEIKKQLAEIRRLLLQRPAQGRRPGHTLATVGTDGHPALGKPEAPITIVEFSDYECPFCRRFFETTLPALKAQYIDTGTVRYVFRDFPLTMHRKAPKAAEAAHCAGAQGHYWEMHDALFKNRALGMLQLTGHARRLGLDQAAFEACLDGGTYADKVDGNVTDGGAAGVTGTPSFIIGKTGSNGTIEGTLIRGTQPLITFSREIDRLLKKEAVEQ